jgi:hypothetical protein
MTKGRGRSQAACQGEGRGFLITSEFKREKWPRCGAFLQGSGGFRIVLIVSRSGRR